MCGKISCNYHVTSRVREEEKRLSMDEGGEGDLRRGGKFSVLEKDCASIVS